MSIDWKHVCEFEKCSWLQFFSWFQTFYEFNKYSEFWKDVCKMKMWKNNKKKKKDKWFFSIKGGLY